MISPENLIRLTFDERETRYVAAMALGASLGGGSQIRSPEERITALRQDQMVGQLGQMALSLYWFGDSRQYDIARWYANRNPNIGDGGSDIPGMNVDVKTSLMRSSEDPLDYRLLIRPKERHEGWIYVLALVKKLRKVGTEVFLVGWAADYQLPKMDQGGLFDGAHVMNARDLNPLPPVQWFLGSRSIPA